VFEKKELTKIFVIYRDEVIGRKRGVKYDLELRRFYFLRYKRMTESLRMG